MEGRIIVAAAGELDSPDIIAMVSTSFNASACGTK
jgi:hypothetical protein